jgi:hypothetical protein
VHHELEKAGDFGLESTGLGNTGRGCDVVWHEVRGSRYVVALVADIGGKGSNVKGPARGK